MPTAPSRSIRLAAAAALVLSAACSNAPGAPATSGGGRLVTRARVAMGGQLELTAWTSDEKGTVQAFDAVFAEFDRLEDALSVWRPGSDIVRLNEAAGDHAVPIAPDVRDALVQARQISEWTNGKFDVTFGALSNLWKFDHDQDNVLPNRRDIDARLPLIDYRQLDIDAQAGTAFLRRAGMRAHLGGIGKGYAVDKSVAILRERGVRDFMIQAGGDMYVSGHRGDRPWRLGIRDPRGPASRVFATLDLADGTFSTSGDYERYFIKDGRRYHHIIDPDLGEPAQGCRSVTIVADRAVVADGLSTGVFIMGPAEGMALVERLPDVEAVIVTASNQVLVSSGLRNRLALTAQPTDAP